MKFPLIYFASILLGITQMNVAATQPESNPLDFPGQDPTGPVPGGPGWVPPIIFVPPVVVNPPDEAYIWTGGNFGSFFVASSWKNGANETPQNFTVGSALNYDLFASNVQFSNPDNRIDLGTGSLSLSNAALNLVNGGTVAQGGMAGNSLMPSLLSLSGGSIVIAEYLQNLNIQESQDSASMVNLISSRSDHNTGNAFGGSTIDIANGSLFLVYSDASASDPVTTQEVLSAYFGSVTLGGFSPEYGLDPTIAEAGDNFIMNPITASTDGGMTSFVGGWSISAVPEPSSVLLSALVAPLLLRRKRLSVCSGSDK